MSSISLCLIAKNEEKNIGRCLNSAKPFVEQMVVVDTGSSDRTVEIASELGAEIYHLEWQDDFSQARNESLDHATGDWILFLDCDEELDHNSGPALRKAVQSEEYNGYWVTIVNTYDQQPSSSFMGFRLFKNDPRHRFQCPIHEQILPAVVANSTEKKLGNSDITIYHYGYEKDEQVHKEKIERNLRILNKALTQYQNTGFIYFYLGVEHQKLGDFEKALEHFLISRGKTQATESYAPAMIRSMVICLMGLKRYQDGLEFIDKYLKIYPDYTDLVHLKGAIYYYLGQIPEALDCMNQCIAMGPPPTKYFSAIGIAEDRPQAFINTLLNSLIAQSNDLVKAGQEVKAFSLLDISLKQLKKAPTEEWFSRLIKSMLLLANSVS